MVRLSFDIDKEIHREIKQMALDKDTQATKLYRKWIKEGLAKEKKKKQKQ